MSMNELLSQLSQVCSTLYDQASSFVSSDPVADSRILDFLLPFPELNLDIPSPDYLVNTLVGVGAPDLLARELSEIHAKSSVELADHYLQNYRDACSEIVSVDQEDRMKSYLRLQQAACRMYKRTVMSWETSLLQSIRDRLRNGGGGVGVKKQPAKGPSFNTNFGPVLEEIFKENPFPSLLVRRTLAQKSGMSIGQINVWFQNHRSRARKEGKVITKRSRKSAIIPVSPRIDSGRDQQTPEAEGQKRAPSEPASDCETLVGTDCGKDSSSSATLSRAPSVATFKGSSDPFAAYVASRSAFPSPYRPSSKDKFSSSMPENSIPFSKPIWRREPLSTSSLPMDVDISAMINSFSSLSLDDGDLAVSSSAELETVAVQIGQEGNPYPFVTRPSPAPLPSLVRRLVKRQKHRAAMTKPAKDAEQIANGGSSLVSERSPFQTSCTNNSEAAPRQCMHLGPSDGPSDLALEQVGNLSILEETLTKERDSIEVSSSLVGSTIDHLEVLHSDGALQSHGEKEDAPLDTSSSKSECPGLLDMSDLPDIPTFNFDGINIPPPSFGWDLLPAEIHCMMPGEDAIAQFWSPSICGTDDSSSLYSTEFGSPPDLPLPEPGIFQDTHCGDEFLPGLESSLSLDLDALLAQGNGCDVFGQEHPVLLDNTDIAFKT